MKNTKMKKIKFIYILFSFIFIGTITGCTNNQAIIKEKIDKANYVRIYLPSSGISLDMNLSTKQWYGYKWVVKDSLLYTYDGKVRDNKLSFNYFRNLYFLYPILEDRITTSEVKKSNYVIVKNVKNRPEQKKIVDVWHDDGFKGYKVKIFYNHDCLPVKVQLIDRETNKWETIAKYSYPHITAKEYEKNWKEYVKEIKAGDFLDE
ncbi:hypothetical protein [Lactobacillus sp. PV034]|uniref:hypothetical protein n=1 Tax=Lactobacillus sp. PV034 TaxID=2594495 RepID=UPI00223F0EAA|nr:hypothetical protein [Lactobacillus sp. PV034]QNQ80627.1 hypothetical protein FP432_03210 [Lactobacillus sp. PV034]